ncbi:ATP-binding protein, partial [Hydrogenophaga sp.]|uniref:ATP-binding protein n=1 Tax=Hydrogenophaga sp. TaxID=1904254 RepID=UPI00169600F9
VQLLRAHRARTQEELHCDPSPDVTRLLRRLEAGAVEPAAAKRAAVPSSAHARPTIFVGREPELSRLEALLTEARAGTLTTCLITGPAGIGKSALIRRF